MTFFLRPLALQDQPSEVLLFVPRTDGPGYLVHSFTYDWFAQNYDQAAPLHVENLKSARSIVDDSDYKIIPAPDGAVEAYAR